MSLSAIVGDDGIVEKARKAADETERAGIKEELELKIANLQMEKDKIGEELTAEEILKEIDTLEGMDADITGNTVDGEYKDYGFIIDENKVVEVGSKIKGEKPLGIVILKTTDEVALEVKLQVVGEVKGDSTITKIEAIDKKNIEAIDDESNRR